MRLKNQLSQQKKLNFTAKLFECWAFLPEHFLHRCLLHMTSGLSCRWSINKLQFAAESRETKITSLKCLNYVFQFNTKESNYPPSEEKNATMKQGLVCAQTSISFKLDSVCWRSVADSCRRPVMDAKTSSPLWDNSIFVAWQIVSSQTQ